MKPPMNKDELQLRAKFDFSKAIRGKFYERYQKAHNITLLEDLGEDSDRSSQNDSQLVEIAGKHLLISRLVAAGLEVAEPLRDKGVDLIVYSDSGDFVARPVQMKASSIESFSLDKKYERFPHLLIVYVWNVQDPEHTEVYALTFEEAKRVLEEKGYDKTASWQERNYYFVRNAGAELKKLLEPHKMTTEKWQQKLKIAS
jgi:hypothetical protein